MHRRFAVTCGLVASVALASAGTVASADPNAAVSGASVTSGPPVPPTSASHRSPPPPAPPPPPPAPPPPPSMPASLSALSTRLGLLPPGVGVGTTASRKATGPIEFKIKLPETPGATSPAPTKSDDDVDYTTKRYEPAGFPLLGGDSDIGFQFGAVGTLSHFADGIRPYAWNMDVVVSASIKEGPTGLQLVQESFLYNGDLVGYLGGKLRLNPQVQYQRTINQGYFGLGDAARGTVPGNYTGPAGRYFEWIDSIANAYVQPRYTLVGPWSVTGVLGYRYMNPTAYADSKLARDAIAKNPDGSPVVRGLQPLSITQLALGSIYDSRDNEIFVHDGTFSSVGVAYQQGIPVSSSIRYGEAQALLQSFRPLGPFVLAGRAVADFQFGHVPFYDLFMSGPFGQSEAIGGGSAVRGVPVGRYSGEIKIYGNAELRSMFLKFHLLKQKVSLGADALFDLGRSWLDYSFQSPQDGRGLGLKYGAGGGIYVLWGQAAIFRIDAAYSPDAAAENPHFPIGFYVADGTMF